MLTQGRPLRVRNNPYIQNWEANRQAEIKSLTDNGKIPVEFDIESMGDDVDDDTLVSSMTSISSMTRLLISLLYQDNARPFLMGKAAAVVNDRKSAKAIVDEMVNDAAAWMQKGNGYLAKI